MEYLIDTNVISETIASKPDKNVANFLRSIPASSMYLSVITLGEIRKGIENLKSSNSKKQKLVIWLESELPKFFSGRVISITMDVADRWGYLLGSSNKSLPAIDSLIAATAYCHNLKIVTRNTKDFSNFPVETINPWNIV